MVSRADPLTLARRAVYGVALTYVSLLIPSLLMILLTAHLGHGFRFAYDWGCLLLVSTPGLIGARLYSNALQNFDRGRESWSEQEIKLAESWLAVVRRKEKLFNWAVVVAALTSMALVIALAKRLGLSAPAETDWRLTFYPALFFFSFIGPKGKLSQLGKRFAPEPAPPKGWSGKIGRIHSDHWGGRRPAVESAQS